MSYVSYSVLIQLNAAVLNKALLLLRVSAGNIIAVNSTSLLSNLSALFVFSKSMQPVKLHSNKIFSF